MQPPSEQPPTETQQIGGAAQRPPNQQDIDPALAVPLQNLDEARNEDSPGRLFQLLENNSPRQTAKGKDW
jgi:Ca-activated chloride channel family protein